MNFISVSLTIGWKDLIASGKMSILPTKTNFDEVPFKVYFVEERNQSTYILGEFVCEKTTLWGYGNMDYPCPVYDGDPSMVEVGDGYLIKGGELDKTGLSYDELLSFGRDDNSYVEHYDTLHGWFISQLIFYAQPTIALL